MARHRDSAGAVAQVASPSIKITSPSAGNCTISNQQLTVTCYFNPANAVPLACMIDLTNGNNLAPQGPAVINGNTATFTFANVASPNNLYIIQAYINDGNGDAVAEDSVLITTQSAMAPMKLGRSVTINIY